MLTNAAPIGVPETLAAQFMDLAQYGTSVFDWQALYSGVFEQMNAPFGSLVGVQPPARPRPAHAASWYAGTYGNRYFGRARVTASRTGLTVQLGPTRVAYRLSHWDGDTFTAPIRSENAEEGSISKVTFTAGRGGRATRMVFEYFDRNRLGTFTR